MEALFGSRERHSTPGGFLEIRFFGGIYKAWPSVEKNEATTGSGIKKILQEARKDLAPSKFGVDSDSCKQERAHGIYINVS